MTDSLTTRILTLSQVPLTLAILCFVSGSWQILLALLVVWAITFRKLSLEEMGLCLFAGLFFAIMNYMALTKNLFAFSNPDLIKMPVYEFVMWPFYVLHTKRLFGGSQAPLPERKIYILLGLYILAFIVCSHSWGLLLLTGALLTAGLILHHEQKDLFYTFYMIILGALIEYTGVYQDHWSYPGNIPGGVPFWFITLWGGTGYFLHRAALPLIDRAARQAKGN